MSEADVLRIIVTLVFILMVILAGAWALRRSGFGRSGDPQQLRVVASQSLGPRASVTIVEVEDARLVLGVTPQQINLLHTLPPGAPAGQESSTQPDARPAGFTAALSRALRQR